MTITIFGATGNVGEYLIRQGLAKGYTVKAFGRNIEKLIDEDLQNDKLEVIKGYVFDAKDVLKAVKGSDFVISALGGGLDGEDNTRSLGMKNIIEQMNKAGVKRLVAVGGIGILDKEDGSKMLMDDEEFPEKYLPVSREHKKVLELLQESNLEWTLVCPPLIVAGDGNENYKTSVNTLPNNDFTATVSAGNVAHFMIHEAVNNKYLKEKVGIVG